VRSGAEIARALGITQSRVSAIKKRALRHFWRDEIRKRKPQPKRARVCRHCGGLLDYDRRQIVELRDAGLSLNAIARAVGGTKRAVSRVLARASLLVPVWMQ
jgi:transcriptional regulator